MFAKKHFSITQYLGLIQAVLDIGLPILGTLIWVDTNLVFSKTETTIKHNSSLFIKSATYCEHNTEEKKINVMYVSTLQ